MENVQVEATEKKPSKRPVFAVYLIAFAASLNSTNLGYDIGVSSGVVLILQDEWKLTDNKVALFMGIVPGMSALGGIFFQKFADKLGRKRCFALVQAILVTGLITVASSQSYGSILFGRIIVGLAIGCGFGIDGLYIAEVAPADHRGRLISYCEVGVCLGILIGFFVNWLFSHMTDKDACWRLMEMMGSILPITLTTLALTVLPESPRWLISHGQHQKAADVLKSTHQPGEDIASLVEGITNQILQDEAEGKRGWGRLLCPDKNNRRFVVAALGCAALQQANGSEAVVAYSPTIFRRGKVATTHEAIFELTILVGFFKTALVFVALYTVDKMGRRPLLIYGYAGMALFLVILSFGLGLQVGWMSVSGVCGFIGCFAASCGPVTLILLTELMPLPLRAKGVGLGVFINRIVSSSCSLLFLPVSNFLGGQAQYFGLFSVVTALATIWIWAKVPETKKMVLEQIHQGTGKMVPGVAVPDATTFGEPHLGD